MISPNCIKIHNISVASGMPRRMSSMLSGVKWSSDRRGINARTVLYFGCGDRFFNIIVLYMEEEGRYKPRSRKEKTPEQLQVLAMAREKAQLVIQEKAKIIKQMEDPEPPEEPEESPPPPRERPRVP